MSSSFGLISATFVFGRLLTVFPLSLKYGANQLKESYFLSSVSACFASRLPEPDFVAFLYFDFFLLNLFFKLSNRCLTSPRMREKMCALLWCTMYSETSTINEDTCFLILWVRNSHQRCSVGKGILRNFAKFKGKHLCQSLFLNKVADLRPATLLKKRLWHRYFLVNFAKFLRTSFLENTSVRLLLYVNRQ